MNEWDERIRTHRVWAEMESLGPVIDSASQVEDSTPETVAGLNRIRAVLAYCGKRLAAADPLITHPQTLESIAINFSTVQSELAAFVSDKNPVHVGNANIAADGAILAFSQIPGAYSPEELGVLVSLVTEYRATVQEALTSARRQVGQFKTAVAESTAKLNSEATENLARLTALFEQGSNDLKASTSALTSNVNVLATTIQQEQQKVTQLASDQQGQFSTAQETRGKEFTESLRLANESFTKLVTDYQSQFSTAQEARSKENVAAELGRQNKFNETITDFGKKLSDQDAEFTKQRTKLVSEYGDKASKILEEVDAKRKAVEDLVGVIGNLGVTSGYLKVANGAKKSMWGWQAVTLGALITLSWTAYKTLGTLEGSDGRFIWGGFAARALLLVSLGVIAAYSGSQADKAFGDERRNRKLALELEAIGPYLAPLPVEEQNKFRLQIGALSFGRDYDPHEHGKSPASALDMLKSKETKEILKVLIEAIGTKAKG